jgi:DNA-binding NarL/FixJ family response regulator
VIRVLLAEDHSLVRHGLVRLLATADDIEVVGGAADGAEAVELAGKANPDVILMDLSMPGMDGIEATRGRSFRPTARSRSSSSPRSPTASASSPPSTREPLATC